MAVSKRLRYEVLRRDNHACRYCGEAAPDVKLTVDHVIPTALGGRDEASNLVTACGPCNTGKSASSPDATLVADVDARAMRWAKAMQLAIEQRAADFAKDRVKTDAFDVEWQSWTIASQPVPRDANWKNSVLRFFAGGLDGSFMAGAIATAMGMTKVPPSEKWRYFCGICWREMDRIREVATEIADCGVADTTGGNQGATPAMDMFPYMDLFDVFLDEVMIAHGASPEARRLASRVLWHSFPEADRAYREWEPPPGPHDEEDDGALEAAKNELSAYTAYYVCNVGLLCAPEGVDA